MKIIDAIKLVARIIVDVDTHPHSNGVTRSARLNVSVSTYLRAKKLAKTEFGVRFKFEDLKLIVADFGDCDLATWREIAEVGWKYMLVKARHKL